MGAIETIFHAVFKDYWPATVVILGSAFALIRRELRLRRKVVALVEPEEYPERFPERRSEKRKPDTGATQQLKLLGRRIDALEQEFTKVRTEVQGIRGEVQDIGALTARVESIVGRQEVLDQRQEIHDREILRLRNRFHDLVNNGEKLLHDAHMTLEEILTVARQIKDKA